jgi:hypothetical protein
MVLIVNNLMLLLLTLTDLLIKDVWNDAGYFYANCGVMLLQIHKAIYNKSVS